MIKLDEVYLMCKDIPIIKFNTYDDAVTILNEELLPHELKDGRATGRSIDRWLERRSLSMDRENAKWILNTLGLPQDDKVTAAYLAKGLTLLDCYWLKYTSTDNWENINLFTNSYSRCIEQLALTGASELSVEHPLQTPESATQGVFAKCWHRESDGIYLYKKDRNGGEVNAEYVSSLIADVLGISHVHYTIDYLDDIRCCKCRLITNENRAILNGAQYLIWKGTSDRSFANWISLPEIRKSLRFRHMLLFDGLIGNTDRHLGNWGFYYDVNTTKLLTVHPIFDNNSAIQPRAYDKLHRCNSTITDCSIMSLARAMYQALPNMHPRVERLKHWYEDTAIERLFYELYGNLEHLEYLKMLLEEVIK